MRSMEDRIDRRRIMRAQCVIEQPIKASLVVDSLRRDSLANTHPESPPFIDARIECKTPDMRCVIGVVNPSIQYYIRAFPTHPYPLRPYQ